MSVLQRQKRDVEVHQVPIDQRGPPQAPRWEKSEERTLLRVKKPKYISSQTERQLTFVVKC